MSTRKRIAVIGLGNLGSELASRLARQCEVLAVDQDEERVAEVADKVQQAVCLDARDAPALRQVITDDFDEAIVSMGDNMESTVLATLHLSKLGLKSIRVKALNDDHAAILQAVGATHVIFPERETARRLAAQIQNPNLLDFIPLEADYRVIELAPPESFLGKTLRDLKLRSRFDVFVVAVKELVPERFTFLPNPDFVVKPSDVLLLIGREQSIMRIRDHRPEDDETEGEAATGPGAAEREAP